MSRRTLAVFLGACLLLALLGGTPRGEKARARIRELVDQNPGIHKSRLSRLSGLSWGSINHHLQVLRRTGGLIVQKQRHRAVIFPGGTPPEQMRFVAMLGRPDRPDLVDYVRQNPGQGVQSMSQHYGVSRKIIRRHLAQLEDVGLIVRSEDYRPKFFLRGDASGLRPRPSAPAAERAPMPPSGPGFPR